MKRSRSKELEINEVIPDIEADDINIHITKNPFDVLRKNVSITKLEEKKKKLAKEENPSNLISNEKSSTYQQFEIPLNCFSTFKPSPSNVVSLPNEDICLIAMNPGETIYFHGSVLICPLTGCFEVLGYSLKPNPLLRNAVDNELGDLLPLTFFPCVSPKTNSILYIESQTDINGSTMRILSNAATNDKKVKDAVLQSEHKCFFEQVERNGEKSVFKDINLWKNIKILLKELNCNLDNVLCLRSFNFSNLHAVETCSPLFKDIFSIKSNGDGSLIDSDAKSETVNLFNVDGFFPVFDAVPQINLLKIPDAWISVTESVLNDILNKNLTTSDVTNRSPIILVVGGKNTGKSTFFKYFINNALNRLPMLATLDTDVGQTEFSPPGVISLQMICSPLLGPPFSHQIIASSQDSMSCSKYIGANSSKHDPDSYIEAMLNLTDEYLSKRQSVSVPLIVNTQGWIKGMGFDLLMHYINRIHPDFVLCLEPPLPAFEEEPSKQNLYSNSNQYNTDNNFYSGMHFSTEVSLNLPQSDENSKVNIISVRSCEERLTKTKLHPTDFRTLSLLGYFSQKVVNPSLPITFSPTEGLEEKYCFWNFDQPLSYRIPYSVEINNFKFVFLNVDILPSQLLIALNGTIVGLIYDKSLNSSTTEEESCMNKHTRFSIKESISVGAELLGLGIIRSISEDSSENDLFDGSKDYDSLNCDKILLQILTPLSPDVLEKVNLIARASGTELPSCMFLSGYENSRSVLPYTSKVPPEGLGSLATRLRHNIQRKKNQN
ncbi:Polynucleotide 5'-hydroxyl-kinase nol9 [Clydaea vesicula]|uniref:Polynucleotide 5'-hydroxyl-kinase GRC3 n=1 Tax=Clydaea vesicula TaxID=447962 RepID=A0AAD5XXT8_9FUNG|nr:Polynucleotide 5'-hydroxyl-kinase nol9 [Clydaea vesicula]